MMGRTLFVVTALLLSVSSMAMAQQTPGRQTPAGGPPGQQAQGGVRGMVVDAESGEALAGASVAVRSQGDAAIVTGALVGDDGAFAIPGLSPGTYYLQVTSLGYTANVTDPFTISPQEPRASAGTIRLARAPIQQEAIEAAVVQEQIVIEPDRNSYRAKDVAPAAASASEVLESIPSVQVDADGKVSLRGNDNVAVQINGRPTPVRGPQLGAYLKQLPAGVVERIEVVPTPSARYDPEGMAGIINIVMKTNVDLGTSGGFTLAAATEHRYNASANLGYQRGAFTAFTSYGFNSDERIVLGINDRERFGSVGVPASFTDQDIDGQSSFSGHNLSNSIDYRLGERDVLSTALTLNRRRNEDASLNLYTELDALRNPLEEYARGRDANNKSLVFDATLAFKRTIQARQHELSAEMRFNRNQDDDHTDLWRQPATSTTPRVELEDDQVDAITRRLEGQLDYTRPLTASVKLETGYKGSARWLNRDFLVLEDSLGTGTWVESALSNAFEFDEQIHAAYAVLSRSLGQWELQAGLRAEHASQDFVLGDENFPRTYNSLFPSGVVLYNVSETTQAKIAYSRRIRRPGTQELNPFPVFMDPQNAFIGNPQLRPEYTDAIELGYTRNVPWGTLQLSPFYRRTTDVIRFIVDTDDVIDGRQVTTVSFENLATSNSYGSDVNSSFQWGQRLTGFASFNIFKMVTDGGSESSLSSDAITWSARFNATTNLSPTLSLQGQWFYRAPMNVERGRFAAFQNTNITLRQKLMGDKATLSLRVSDPFKKAGFHIEVEDENIFQITDRRFNARALHLTFQYNFGQAPRIRPPRQDQPAEPQAGFPQ